MQKSTIKGIVLVLVFAVSVLVFGGMTNHTNEDLTREMEEATLPVVSLYQNDVELNELHGYSTEMDMAYMRDAIMPIGKDRKLPITIQTYQTAVDTISYEIRSLDAERLIANADVTSYEEKKGKINAELTIQNLLQAGEEYLLIIQLECGDKTVYYYTRIMEPVDAHVEECVEFVLDFNDKTFNSETTGSLATYMERTTGDNSNLHYVSLHSSLKQVGWADFEGKRLTDPMPSIKEITNTYSVIVLDYVVSSVGEAGELEYYNVEEYYRVRYTSSRIYLLNFERRMNQIFRGENQNIYDAYIQLGIRSGDVEYKANEAGNNVAFVQEGELWSYNVTEHTLAKVFSFRGYEGIDIRENYGEHDIKIVDIDEAGSVDYIVYGYMNRGIHEGQVGMAVYHYDGLSNANEEQVFIPSRHSYEVMKSELGKLMYVNDGGELFLMMEGNVYGIDLNTREVRAVIEDLADGSYAVSETNRYVAWTEGKDTEAAIHILNLSNLKTVGTFEGKQNELVRPLGFMGEDFVYGISRKEDILEDAAGNVTMPMYRIKIMDVTADAPEELKTYERNGYYVSDVEIDGYTMYLNRIQYNGTAFVGADRDMIMNREGDGSQTIAVASGADPVKKTLVRLAVPGMTAERSLRLLTPKETILPEERTVEIKTENRTGRYYVYVKGDVLLSTDKISEAVITANENFGVVIGDNQKYVWKRARKTAQNAFSDIGTSGENAGEGSIAQCINAMLEKEGININVEALIASGETPKSILHNTMRDAVVLDLTGCSVDEILYYVSCGSPVFAMTESEEAVLIVGYDAGSISIYDPKLGITYRESIAEADELFANVGKVFFTYLTE